MWRKHAVIRVVATTLIMVGAASGIRAAIGVTPAGASTATPTISTQQQPTTATAGSSVADQATVSGGAATVSCPSTDLSGDPLSEVDESPGSINCTYMLLSPYFGSAYCYWELTYEGWTLEQNEVGGCPATPIVNTPPTPMGTVTFNLYDNPNGTGTPLFTDTENLVGGVATSAGYLAIAVGTDYWVATYNGDSNYSAVSSSTSAEPVTVVARATPLIITSSLPDATKGVPYSYQLVCIGGTPPYTWNKYPPKGTGKLPIRISLSRSGLLSGTPKMTGTFDITVKCLDASHSHKTQSIQTLTLTVDP